MYVSNYYFPPELMKKKISTTNQMQEGFDNLVCEKMEMEKEKRRSVLRLSHCRVKDMQLQ